MTTSEATSVISRANDQAVWPWQAEPYRLWSLWEMLNQLRVGYLVPALGNLERATAFTEMILTPPPDGGAKMLRQALPQYRTHITSVLDTLQTSGVKLSPPVDLMLRRILVKLDDRDQNDFAAIAAECRQARQAVIDDFGSHLFLSVPDKALYEQPAPLFGDSVHAAFPDGYRDIAAAGRCIALREGTAAVFHLMRVLEHGLRLMATRFGVPFATDSWHKVIRGIEDGINDLRNKQGLTDHDRAEITYYSDAASQFRHFKDAWRNHVSHAREHYSADEAQKVMNHVREFMLHLASPI
jgi:hypothetical protein